MKIEKEEKNVLLIFISIFLMIIILGFGTYFFYKEFFKKDKESIVLKEDYDYDFRLIREVQKSDNKNFLISPYSIEIALNMLRDGTDGQTRKQIEDLIGERKINYFQSEGKINVANGLFVNKKYKNSILDSYYDIIKNKYHSDIIYDKFKEVKVVNDWVNKKTYKMIPNLLDNLKETDLLVLVNALAIDVQWKKKFDCNNTYEQEFTKVDGTKYGVEMMHNTYEQEAKYFKSNDSIGVIIPYKEYDGNKLEFISVLPNGDINNYVNNLVEGDFKQIDQLAQNVSTVNVMNLSLPKFKYDYEIENFDSNLKHLGIQDVFDSEKADLSKMIDISSYVSKIVHKVHIEVKEKGIKAAASTSTGVLNDSSEADNDTIDYNFNKPFVYIIREQRTNEMLFFGVVYEPNKWNGLTCEK